MLRYIGNPSADSSNLGKVRLFIGRGGGGADGATGRGILEFFCEKIRGLKMSKDVRGIERRKRACGECEDFMRSDGTTCG